MLLPTTLVGSYPQPEWLIDRAKLAGRFPPRVRARELWRVPEPWLAEAQDDATRLAIRAQEQAGLDVITDGEVRRESYSNRLLPRWTASTSSIPAPRSIAPAIPIRCRASWDRCAASIRCRWRTCAFCARTRTGRSR